jgi:hypothetical protein
MAAQDNPAQTDKDLASIAEARTLARAARQAQPLLAELTQEQIDRIVTDMANAVTPHAEALAALAVEETGYGVVADKVQKNLFSSRQVYEFIAPMKTVGVVNRIEDKKIVEIAEPFGVVAAIVPSTNPTSTAIYKVLIALKARCPNRDQSSSLRGAVHHASGRDHGGSRGAGRRTGRQHRLDEDGHTRRHAGVDEAPRCGGHSRDRRSRPRTRRVLRGQAGVRSRTR